MAPQITNNEKMVVELEGEDCQQRSFC